jgi:hypothetical protein
LPMPPKMAYVFDEFSFATSRSLVFLEQNPKGVDKMLSPKLIELAEFVARRSSFGNARAGTTD